MKRIIPCVLITLALILAGFFLPVVGFIGLMLCPLPLCVLGCLEGSKNMGIAEFTVELTLFIIISPTMALYFLLGCAPVAAIIYSVSREDIKRVKKFTGPESLLICNFTSIIFKTILLAVYYFFTGKNILFPDVSELAVTFQQLYDEAPELRQAIVQALSLFPYLLPMLLVIYAGVETFLNYVLCGRFVKKFLPSSENFPPALPEFTAWRFSGSLLFVLVVSFIAGYFITTEVWLEGAVFLMNLQLVINALMFVQGLAFAFWLMEGFKVNRGVKIFICFLLTIPFFWSWLIVMGMSDMALNLRNRIKFKSS